VNNIKHIFFDLDRTLWDFETNSRKVISDLFHENNLADRCQVPFCEFIEKYEEINFFLWDKYQKAEITKQQLRSSRFFNAMQHFGHDDFELGYKMEEEYVKRSPWQKSLMPGAEETLLWLSKNYSLHIITNGFKEVQHIKLESCGIKQHFQVILISEEVGLSKPDKAIFDHAMDCANAKPFESLMVGDDLHVDVLGAINSDMKGCFFNPSKISHSEKIHAEIHELAALPGILGMKSLR
jgi:putative hydrolase of the HAD superfamily